MTQEIVVLCQAMGAGEDREELLLPLVQAVERQLTERLREGVAPEDCGPAFPMAAAMMVMGRLSAVTGGRTDVTSFTAGDLTIRQQAGGNAGSLSEQAEALLAPWLRGKGFCFRGVEG